MVRAYYHEVTKGILHGTSLDELMALLREFSREVLTNAPLKVIVFDTKEVLGLLVNLWKALLEKVPRTLAISNDPKWKRLIPQERVRRTNIYSQLKATIDESVDLHALQDDFNQYLLTIVADRLKILALVSQSLAAIFFGSELLTLRAEAVTSDDPVSPLGLSSWFAMLFCDPVATICEAVGLDVNTIDSVMLSITEATAAPESPRKSKRGWGTPNKVAPFSPGPLVRASSGLSIDQDAISTLPRCK